MKILACIMLWGLLAVGGCVARLDSLLPAGHQEVAAEVAPGAPIAGQGVPRGGVIRLVGNIYTNRLEGDPDRSPGSFSYVGAYHPPHQWEVLRAPVAKPDPPVVVVVNNVVVQQVQQPQRRWHGRAERHTQKSYAPGRDRRHFTRGTQPAPSGRRGASSPIDSRGL